MSIEIKVDDGRWITRKTDDVDEAVERSIEEIYGARAYFQKETDSTNSRWLGRAILNHTPVSGIIYIEIRYT